MKHFKHRKAGFSFLELMIAITLLSIFGTTIFMLQSNIVEKTYRTHITSTIQRYIDTIEPDFMLKKMQHLHQKLPLDSIVITKNITNPAIDITLRVKEIPEQSSLHKDFGKYIRIVDQELTTNTSKKNIVSFTFAPSYDNTKETA